MRQQDFELSQVVSELFCDVINRKERKEESSFNR